MRRTGRIAGRAAIALMALMACATASIQPVLGATSVEWQPQATSEWDAAETGAGGRSIQVAYRTDSCGERNAHTTVRESRSSVTVHVLREVSVHVEGTGPISCPAPRADTLSVPLRRPLAGRLIYGRSPKVLANPRNVFGYRSGQRITVPRLIGFSPQDAKQALTYGYLRGQLLYRRRGSGRLQVVAQRPVAGRTVPGSSVVRFVVTGSQPAR